MNTAAIAKALRDLADAIDQPTVGSAPRPLPSAPSPLPMPPGFDELPPDDQEFAIRTAIDHQAQRGAQIVAQDAALGVCPTHGTAWTVKPGGVSKAGKSYNAFWKCSGKNADDTYCNLKPTKVWADTHPIRDAA